MLGPARKIERTARSDEYDLINVLTSQDISAAVETGRNSTLPWIAFSPGTRTRA